MNKNEEKLLVQRAKNGDREALSLLWDEITPKLFGYLINTTRNKILAEDLLQSTWIKAIEAFPKFQQKGIGISSWLFAIARNECRQHWRKSNREIPFDPVLHDQPFSNQKELDAKILADQIMSFLSEEDRELLRLRYIADLPLNEIARILNINFVAVRVRLHRVLNRAKSIINSKP